MNQEPNSEAAETVQTTSVPAVAPSRSLPKFTYVSWHKAAPNSSPNCWKRWFSIRRYWGGKLIYVEVRHHSFQFDFRRNWLADFLGENKSSNP